MVDFYWVLTITCYVPFVVGHGAFGKFSSLNTNQCVVNVNYTGKAGLPVMQFGTYGPYSIIAFAIVAIIVKILLTKW